jgi:hypothetical protein
MIETVTTHDLGLWLLGVLSVMLLLLFGVAWDALRKPHPPIQPQPGSTIMARNHKANDYLSEVQANLLRRLIKNGPLINVVGEEMQAARDKLVEMGAAAMIIVQGEQAGCAATYFGQELYKDFYDKPVERNVNRLSDLPSRVIRRN